MKAILKRLWSDDRGANAVEYGLIAAIIAVGLILAFTVFRDELFALFERQSNEIREH
jgi:pilus assembly protein Flp/PilA